jgi:hypothetical protein
MAFGEFEEIRMESDALLMEQFRQLDIELPATWGKPTEPGDVTSRWYLNAEYLSELDEEYRKKNQKFRAFVKSMATKPDHALGFLSKMVDRNGRWLFDAGHVVPVLALKRRGTKLERLVVEDRTLNRSKQARKIGSIINIEGVPVDCASVDRWRTTAPAAYRTRLEQFWLDCQAKRNTSTGWHSKDERVHEFEFVLALPGEIWVRACAS